MIMTDRRRAEQGGEGRRKEERTHSSFHSIGKIQCSLALVSSEFSTQHRFVRGGLAENNVVLC
jgi:hypothetical protein